MTAPQTMRRSSILALALALTSIWPLPIRASDPTPAAVPVDPGARLLEGSAAGESWDVNASLADGSHLFVRFWVTNEGPGSHTAAALGYFLRPDGRVDQFRYARTRDRWQPDAGGRLLKIASAVLDLRAPSGAVEIDTDKYGIKIHLDFAMPASPPPLCSRRQRDAGFDVLRLREPATGSAWTRGMPAPVPAEAVVDITHSWGTDSEIDTVLRRIDASGRSGDVAFFATAVAAPGALDRNQACVAVTNGADGVVYETRGATVTLADTGVADGDDDYPVPNRMDFAADGLGLTVQPRRELLRVDPLDVVPQPFRLLLSFRSSPQRIWSQDDWHLRLGGSGAREPLDVEGRGVAGVTYTNPP